MVAFPRGRIVGWPRRRRRGSGIGFQISFLPAFISFERITNAIQLFCVQPECSVPPEGGKARAQLSDSGSRTYERSVLWTPERAASAALPTTS